MEEPSSCSASTLATTSSQTEIHTLCKTFFYQMRANHNDTLEIRAVQGTGVMGIESNDIMPPIPDESLLLK